MKKEEIKDLKVIVSGREFTLAPVFAPDSSLMWWNRRITLDDYFAISGLAHSPIRKTLSSFELYVYPDFSCNISWFEKDCEKPYPTIGGLLVIGRECVIIKNDYVGEDERENRNSN